MLAASPALGRAEHNAGYKILLHSFLDSEHTGSGYFSLAEIVVHRAYQVSSLEVCPNLTLEPQLRAILFNLQGLHLNIGLKDKTIFSRNIGMHVTL